MRITIPASHMNYMKYAKTEKNKEEAVDQSKGPVKKETAEDVKQALREMAQRHLAEIQEARTDMGEDDPKAQEMITKFKSGQKLSQEEMNYIRKNAPGIVEYIDRVQKEREMIELSMRRASSKMEVQMVAYRALQQIEKHPNPEEREVRARHLSDAKYRYEQTEEYKEKPDGPLDEDEKKISLNKAKYKPKQGIKDAIGIYERGMGLGAISHKY